MVRVVNLVRAGFCALGVTIGSATAFATDWPEVELTSCCEPSLEPYCGETLDCGSACSSSIDCGYCFSFPMCDEFTAKLTPMMMQMAESGFIYSPVLTQFYQGVADGGADTGFE